MSDESFLDSHRKSLDRESFLHSKGSGDALCHRNCSQLCPREGLTSIEHDLPCFWERESTRSPGCKNFAAGFLLGKWWNLYWTSARHTFYYPYIEKKIYFRIRVSIFTTVLDFGARCCLKNLTHHFSRFFSTLWNRVWSIKYFFLHARRPLWDCKKNPRSISSISWK